jgi:DNA helicase-2/ATP-dependent DNA helicase PcrA
MAGQVADPRELILSARGHVLATGAAGSGKTTVALRKAMIRVESGLKDGQAVLFLSFSRAAVHRMAQASKIMVASENKRFLALHTFHSFCWELLKTHAYLLGAPRRIALLQPQDERVLSNGARRGTSEWTAWEAERERLFREEGRIAFDLFAPKVTDILKRSRLIRELCAWRFPLLIVDEAQDTGPEAWHCVELLAPLVQVVCLADIEQQIFDHLPGIGPERIAHIKRSLDPLVVYLGSENKRSPGTEIAAFANDILECKVRRAPYRGVSRLRYHPDTDWAKLMRVALARLFKAIEGDCGKRGQSWAILAPTSSGVARITTALSSGDRPVRHKVLFDDTAVLLSSRLAAFLLEPKPLASHCADVAIGLELLADVRRARGSKTGIEEAAKLQKWARLARGGKIPKTKLATAVEELVLAARQLSLSGDPGKDWRLVEAILQNSGDPEVRTIAAYQDCLVAYNRGRLIAGNLSDMWSEFRCYPRAREALDRALAEDQMVSGVESLYGLHVMTIHRSKGKQFDGVIILRERNPGEGGWKSSFIWRDDPSPHMRSRKILRVAITRAIRHVIILDPVYPTCPILSPFKL